MHRPWILLGASFGLLAPATALSQPAQDAPAAKGAAPQVPAEPPPKATAQPKRETPAHAQPAPSGSAKPPSPEPASAEPTRAEAGAPAPAAEEAPTVEGEEPPTEAEPAEAAAPARPTGATAPLPDDEEPELPMTPPAADTLGGHFMLSVAGAFVNPSGRYSSSLSDNAGWGWLFGADAGYGVSRSVVLGAWGHYQDLPGSGSCSDCTATSWAVGPFVRFHLVQGLRFDPWMLFSVGYRQSNVTPPPLGPATDPPSNGWDFSGFDWARIQVGGDWYAFKSLGFGPFLELDSGGFTSRDSGGNLRAHWHFAAGLRLVLDVPGKP